MPKCGICGGEAPKQPCITEDGKCDLCGKKVALAEKEEEEQKK
jgi:phosphoribosylaminoimidazole (AIR) synthetase